MIVNFLCENGIYYNIMVFLKFLYLEIEVFMGR